MLNNRLMKSYRDKNKKALTIEYVLIMMTLVVSIVAVMLGTMFSGGNRSGGYRKYIERKQFLDKIGMAYIAKTIDHDKSINMDKFNENDFGYKLVNSGNGLIVKFSQRVVLFVEVGRVDGQMVLLSYQYGV